MADLVAADEGPIREQILDATYSVWHEGLSRPAYGRFYAGQLATSWGRGHLCRLALVDDGEVLASAKQYVFDATLDGRPIRIAGVGAVFTPPAHRGRGAARDLIERLLARAAAGGADLALLFSEIGPEYYARLGFAAIATTDRRLRVAESAHHGAPATMVRGGEPRDLQAIAAMGKVRADAFRFHLDRDEDLIQYAITKKRLLAGLGPAGARELHFFIAEEGTTAAAYVVVSIAGGMWTVEECGDRDPTGARVGAILQGLIAREPAERRPAIAAWLPAGFLPPQVTIIGEQPSHDVMMVRALAPAGERARTLCAEDVMYWRADVF